MKNQPVINQLSRALNTWQEKLAEVWSLLSETPQLFKGGDIWDVIVEVHGGLQAIGYALLIVFFVMSLFKSTLSFREFRNPEVVFGYFIRFLLARIGITYGLDIMETVFAITAGIVANVASNLGALTEAIVLPDEIITAVGGVDFLSAMPLWLVSFLGSIIVTVLSFVVILTCYGRFFRLFLYIALSPITISTFAGEMTSSVGRSFIKSYVSVCMEGVVIVLACVLYSAFIGSGNIGIVDTDGEAVTMVWAYLVELIFNMLILVGMIKGADRVVKEMLAL